MVAAASCEKQIIIGNATQHSIFTDGVISVFQILFLPFNALP